MREQPLTVAVASSLTELFAPKIHKERISGMLENYDFIDDKVMAYFKRRLTQAPRDADFALDYVKKHARRRAASRKPASTPCASSATCCGCSSTRCTTPTSSRAHSAGRLPSGDVQNG